MSNTSYSYKLLKEFYRTLRRHSFKAGTCFPIEIDQRCFLIAIFPSKYSEYESFGILLPEAKFARKSFYIREDGDIIEDKRGTIPPFDLTNTEPCFKHMSDKELVLVVAQQLQAFLS